MSEVIRTRKKLIEVALPLPEINDASAFDKRPGIGPHPKGIHHWWARLPLPVARAVLFASVVDDPSENPEKFRDEEAQTAERERLFAIIRGMMQKQLHKHPEVYAQARTEMLKQCDGRLPQVLDPFSGGGSIPLEAARLGFGAYAGDLNPVAVLLNRCTLELAPRWADCPPSNPEDRGRIGGTESWIGTAGLAADVSYYGRRILQRAREKLSHFYPSADITPEIAHNRADLEAYVGKQLPVIAWIWARTVASPDPAARSAHVPLVSTFWLANKKGGERWLDPIVDRVGGTWHFTVRTDAPEKPSVVKAGTKIGRATFRCLLTDAPISDDYIKVEGRAGRINTRLVAIVAEGQRGRVYLPAIPQHEEAARRAKSGWKPEFVIQGTSQYLGAKPYGMDQLFQLFTPRQLTALTTLSDFVREIHGDVQRDAALAGLRQQDAEDYARTVVTFLALVLDRCADTSNSLCRWDNSAAGQRVKNLFGRQAIPMIWDFAECNVLGDTSVCWLSAVNICVESVTTLCATASLPGHARPIDAASMWNGIKDVLISTDPPYYDNIPYSNLSDFFYVWLRRTIGDLHPDLFQTILVPKQPELVAAPERFDGDKENARQHFHAGFRRAFGGLREKMDPRFPLTVYYAFKQDDEETGAEQEVGGESNGVKIDRTTGWETMLDALVGTHFQITATWPVRASQAWRMRAMGSNALASYIVLACRPRPEDAPQTDRRSFVAELKRELPIALKHLQQGNVAPVDFAQAAIGPGMAIYSRYSRIVEASGQPLAVRTALALINQTLAEALSEQEGEFDNDTRWAITWFEQHGFEAGDFGEAELLSKAKVTSIEGLHRAGIINRGGGKVQLLAPSRLAADWDPDHDNRLTVWEIVHQLIRIFESEGESGAAALAAKLGSKSEVARDLAYRLYSICERKKRAQEALAYNGLVQSWPEIVRLARETGTARTKQSGLFVESEE